MWVESEPNHTCVFLPVSTLWKDLIYGKNDLASSPECVPDTCAWCPIAVRLACAPELTPRLRGLMSACADSRGERLILLEKLSMARESSRGLRSEAERKWPNLTIRLNVEAWCWVCSNNITDLLKRQRSCRDSESSTMFGYGCSGV